MATMEPTEVPPLVVDKDVRETIQGLSPGWYPARSLYERYVDQMTRVNRTPGHPTAFGQVLARLGYVRRKVTRDGRQIHGWSI